MSEQDQDQTSNITDTRDVERFWLFAGYNANVYANRLKIYSQSDYDYAREHKQLSWNWASFFLGVYWMAYRKMWGWVSVYFAYFVLSDLLFSQVSALDRFVNFVISILIGMYGNAMYFAHAAKKIDAIKRKSISTQEKNAEYERVGGTSGGSVALAIVLTIAIITLLIKIEQL
ncbi:DUF2628 domain-containing protein [Bacillus sp. AFS041924]|uniref:DUF2628 domain-containing protein n=1 Tax=Bacillus sp. AFS041924 TaxID=2033503 RepID=UPI000BFB903C|nr:DUF2628 domain-containing protein [Bacillus sp. AFS041924]PGS49402.1 hypothetical protein COC46_15310 [Bacillus sp. AFS041924]